MIKLASALAIALTMTSDHVDADGISHDTLTNTDSSYTTRPDSHAPIRVMGDHMHKTGEFMVSLRQMKMHMRGTKNGRDSMSDSQVLATQNTNGGMFATLRVVPEKMSMDMTMIGAMYAPNDNLTWMIGTAFKDNKMTARSYSMMGNLNGTFTTRSQGWSDTTVTALIKISDRLHTSIGLSLPTGSIKESGLVLSPMNTIISSRLPYAMQLGSGTYDFKPALTYNLTLPTASFGAQVGGTFRIGENSQSYALGNEQFLTIWTAKPLSENISVSGLLSATAAQDIRGKDVLIDKPVQSAQTIFYGGERVQFSLGLNWIGTRGFLTGHRIGFDVSKPIYENLNGPQMSHDWQATLGYQKAF